MSVDASTAEKFKSLVHRLLSKSWIFAILITFLAGITAYLSASTPSLRKVAAGGVFGFAIGIVYMLELNWARSTFVLHLICSVVGAIAGGLMCLLLSLSPIGVLLGVLIGALLGATYRFWINHINLP